MSAEGRLARIKCITEFFQRWRKRFCEAMKHTMFGRISISVFDRQKLNP